MSILDQVSTSPAAQETERLVARRAFGVSLLCLLPLLCIYWSIPYDAVSEGVLDAFNAALPCYFMAVTISLGVVVAKTMEGSIWTPLVWFPIQSGIFFGFGPLVEIFGNEITREIASAHYLAVTPTQLYRAHQLSVTGITMFLFGLYLHLSFARRSWTIGRTEEAISPTFDPLKLGWFFVAIGMAFKYLIHKPSKWDQIDILVPGFLSSMVNVADLGFAILAFCAARGQRSALKGIIVLLPLHVILSAISFSKLEVMMALALPTIGAFVGKPNTRVFVMRLVGLAFLFTLLQPFIEHGRATLIEHTGTHWRAGYVQRIDIFGDYLLNGSIHDNAYEQVEQEEQGWWGRLNFTGPQIAAMELYDNGFANPKIAGAWMYFIPRAIWPDKPLLFGGGLELYRLVSGNEDSFSSLGLSIYGDLYWQYGWAGVFVGSTLLGVLMGVLTARSMNYVRQREYIMMPFVLLVLRTGLLGPNKFVIPAFIGALPVLIFYALLLHAITWLVKGRRSQPKSAGVQVRAAVISNPR